MAWAESLFMIADFVCQFVVWRDEISLSCPRHGRLEEVDTFTPQSAGKNLYSLSVVPGCGCLCWNVISNNGLVTILARQTKLGIRVSKRVFMIPRRNNQTESWKQTQIRRVCLLLSAYPGVDILLSSLAVVFVIYTSPAPTVQSPGLAGPDLTITGSRPRRAITFHFHPTILAKIGVSLKLWM